MSDRPVFLYAAIYDEIVDAEADYEAVFDLHAMGAIGTFDSAVIRRDEDGKVHVTKTEKPTQHGAWTGAGVGALVGLVFPPAIIGSAIVGAGAGGLIGHLRGGISRGDLKELGEELEGGSAAVIVIGESKIEEQLEKAITRANKLIEKQIDADAEELRREIDAAAREDAKYYRRRFGDAVAADTVRRGGGETAPDGRRNAGTLGGLGLAQLRGDDVRGHRLLQRSPCTVTRSASARLRTRVRNRCPRRRRRPCARRTPRAPRHSPGPPTPSPGAPRSRRS